MVKVADTPYGNQLVVPASGGPGGVVDTVAAGSGIGVDSTDPANPVVTNNGVRSITAGSGITVDNTNPRSPVIAASGGAGSPLLGRMMYAPAVAEVKAVVSGGVLRALDATNLTVAFHTNPSGAGSVAVLVDVHAYRNNGFAAGLGLTGHGGTTQYGPTINIVGGQGDMNLSFSFLITGLTPDTDYQFDLAGIGDGGTYNILSVGSTGNASTDNGPVTMAVWAA